MTKWTRDGRNIRRNGAVVVLLSERYEGASDGLFPRAAELLSEANEAEKWKKAALAMKKAIEAQVHRFGHNDTFGTVALLDALALCPKDPGVLRERTPTEQVRLGLEMWRDTPLGGRCDVPLCDTLLAMLDLITEKEE